MLKSITYLSKILIYNFTELTEKNCKKYTVGYRAKINQ